MTTPKILPTEWHRRPKGMVGPCAVCGCAASVYGEHRAVSPDWVTPSPL